MSSHPSLLLHDRDELLRQLEDARETIAQLRAELAASMLPYQGHESHVVDGVLTIVQKSGIVYEMVGAFTATDYETTFRREFRKLPSVPGSPAARIEAAMGAAEMAVVDDSEEALAS